MSLLPDATLNASYQAYKEHCSRRPDKAFMPHPATAPLPDKAFSPHPATAH
ncbi:TPA: hypothetical protein P9474_000618 [Escherichia coli]|nr:hypothetical protein [Escherichia coli]HDQ5138083.1 hypothetical protein [Escherichia coli]